MRQMTVCLVLVVSLFAAAEARAQDSWPPPSPPPLTDFGTADFFFGRPKATVGVRGNWLFARAKSDWYSFVTDQLLVDKKDFNAPGIATDVGFAVSRRAEAVVGVEFNQAKKDSEYRNFVDNNRLPINQSTRLNVVHATGGIKYALVDRGRAIGRQSAGRRASRRARASPARPESIQSDRRS